MTARTQPAPSLGGDPDRDRGVHVHHPDLLADLAWIFR